MDALIDSLLPVLVFLPTAAALLCLAFPKKLWPTLGLFSSLTALICLLIVTYLSIHLTQHKPFVISFPWMPEAFVHFSLRADGLSLFFSLLVTGMGTLIFFYANYFMRITTSEIRRFYCYMLLFMGSMLGAVLADNLIVMFLFWEMTGVMSYLLISYHFDDKKALTASRMALFVTSLASLGMLAGIILIGIREGTLEISQLASQKLTAHPDFIVTVMSLMLFGIFAKSAQFPLHFWLPEAMKAPTPVSAYLHSATMVKLGIYLLARIYVLFVDSPFWFPLVTSVSLTTVIIGGILALFSTSLKRLLAYATISQLGFFISFYGSGSPQGLEYDFVHIFNHALYKASLFMLVGILAHAANITDIRQLPGLPKRLPLVSIAFAISIAAMAGVPGTTGFLSKELLLKDVLVMMQKDPTGVILFSALFVGLLIKVAFSYRLFSYIFISPAPSTATPLAHVSYKLMAPPLILSTLALILGVWPRGLEALVTTFFTEGLHKLDSEHLLLWHGWTLNLIVSACLFIGGVILAIRLDSEEHHYDMSITFFGKKWDELMEALPHFAKRLTTEIHGVSPQQNLYWPLILFSIAIAVQILSRDIHISAFSDRSMQTLVEITITVLALYLVIHAHPVHKLIVTSTIGMLITFYFVLKSAPDLAITQMVVEVATLFVFVLLFLSMHKERRQSYSPVRAFIAAAFGLSVALIPLFYGTMDSPFNLSQFFLDNSASLANSTNVVNAIIIDFRGLDTLGEIAVILAAALGIYGLCLSRSDTLVEHFEPLIPTPVLPAIIPATTWITFVFSLYLLIRGHNYPGGGFSGGVMLALALVLVGMTIWRSRLMFLDRANPLFIANGGLLLALAAAALPLLFDQSLLSAITLNGDTLTSTPFLFDAGIYVLVVGAVVSIIYIMRDNVLKESIK